MKQYRLICDDTGAQCGDVYDRDDWLVMDAPSLVAGHDEAHGHMVQVREVSEWMAYAPTEVVQ